MDTLLDVASTVGSVVQDFDRHAVLWALILGIILAFLLGAGMGANDVSNAFGTSVGSGVVTIIQAYILASIFETLGSVLVGWKVIGTMRGGVIEVKEYEDQPEELFLGQVAILGGCATWLMIATVLHMPVSTTHSIVGATVGFSIVLRGLAGINWSEIVRIVISWFVSPLLSGFISTVLYIVVDHLVLRQSDSVKAGLRVLPAFYFVCLTFNTAMVTWDGSPLLYLNHLPWWAIICISLGVGVLAAFFAHFVLRPRILRKIQESTTQPSTPEEEPEISKIPLDLELTKKGDLESQIDSGSTLSAAQRFWLWLMPDKNRPVDEKTTKLFGTIQIFTACFAGFAHGANDVCNAVAPLASLISIYRTKSVYGTEDVPIYVVLYGVFAICVGLWLLGHHVIRTVGTKMSEINPASGFCIEFGAAMTGLLASKLGLPISTTHCLVGSVVAVGSIRSGEGVKWGIFRSIVLSWVVTLPVAGLVSAGIMILLKLVAL
ncbi:unnamed protein product [Caenorhabditis auriculariae]|uniref:Phosphate transporter n=1 Tax=Caenorhabditis auriculariae TaxID=2777116 RepID=A0A8S1HKY5_9PELO|nr:unnamed protein product [Caenorhabditis auriculariae]